MFTCLTIKNVLFHIFLVCVHYIAVLFPRYCGSALFVWNVEVWNFISLLLVFFFHSSSRFFVSSSFTIRFWSHFIGSNTIRFNGISSIRFSSFEIYYLCHRSVKTIDWGKISAIYTHTLCMYYFCVFVCTLYTVQYILE